MAEASSPYVPTNDELSDEVADILIEVSHSLAGYPSQERGDDNGAFSVAS